MTPGATSGSDDVREPWRLPHDRAVAAGEATYLDPATGCSVFTSAYLRARGTCCDSGCRHCPYRDPYRDIAAPDS